MSTTIMDCDQSKHRTPKILSVAGCMMLLVPCGFDLYWGNASIYVISFMASRLEPADEFLINSPISLHLAVVSVVVLGCGCIIKRVNRSLMIILGVVISNVSICMNYFAVQQSLEMLNLTLGGLLAVGSGIIYSCALQIVIERAQGDEGVLCALLLVGYSIGGLINCQIITWYINPNNENPNLKIGSYTVFTNKDIIDSVPPVFLLLGCFMLIVQVLGMLMLLVSSWMISENNPSKRLLERMYLKARNSTSEEIYQKTPGPKTETIKNTPKAQTDTNQINQPTDFGYESIKSSPQDADNESTNSNTDRNSSEMLRSPAFYSCWISLFIAEISYNVATNLYKLYGLQWIPDDHFLAIIGSLNTPATAVFRMISGIAIDKIGPKLSIIGLQVSIVVFGAWFVLTPMASRWLYMFFTLVYVGVNGAMYPGSSGAIAQIFGKTHFSTNVGYIFTAAVASNILVPFIITFLRGFGWFTLFAGTSSMNIISLCFCLKFLPSLGAVTLTSARN